MGEGSAAASGKVIEGDLHVVYVYKAKPQPKTGSVYVKYITEDGTVLEEESAVKTNAPVGTDYTTTQKTFDNYEFSKMGEGSAAASGKIVEGDLHVVYVYKAKQQPKPNDDFITNYLDQNGNKISPSDKGTQKPKEIPGYEFIKTENPSDKETNHIYKKIAKERPPKITFWTYPKASEPVSDKGLLNKEDHKAYMFGYPDKTFGPDRNMTREEVTTMFARLLKDYPRARRTYAIPYSDVSQKDWSYEAIGFMTEKGMIKGYEDGTFRPKEPVTRAEFATIASRFDALRTGEANRFSDLPETHWAVEAINSAAAKGWVKGYPDGTFKPDQKITRSEVVSITNIMLDRFADKDFVRSHLHEMIAFTDLTEGNWAYFPIMEATHGHDYTRKAAEQEENWIRLNGEEFWFPALYAR